MTNGYWYASRFVIAISRSLRTALEPLRDITLLHAVSLFSQIFDNEQAKVIDLIVGLLSHVTGFKWYESVEAHEIYLSVILNPYNQRIIAHVIGDRNDNPLVFKTYDKAVKENPGVHPLFHSDRGTQYTNRAFHAKPEQMGMTQSISLWHTALTTGR